MKRHDYLAVSHSQMSDLIQGRVLQVTLVDVSRLSVNSSVFEGIKNVCEIFKDRARSRKVKEKKDAVALMLSERYSNRGESTGENGSSSSCLEVETQAKWIGTLPCRVVLDQTYVETARNFPLSSITNRTPSGDYKQKESRVEKSSDKDRDGNEKYRKQRYSDGKSIIFFVFGRS